MSKSKKVGSIISEVPELCIEGIEELLCQVLDMDIFTEDLKPERVPQINQTQFKNLQCAKNTLINVLLDTTREMNRKIARLCAIVLERDPKSPIALDYQIGRENATPQDQEETDYVDAEDKVSWK